MRPATSFRQLTFGRGTVFGAAFGPDGRSVVIDSPHLGGGRQLHRIDLSGIVG